MASNLITIGNIKMNNLYEVVNISLNEVVARQDLLSALKIAVDVSKINDDHYEVLKNNLRFATVFKGELDIILPKQTFLEG